ncbi:MAG: hypothetical protein AB1656_06550 [Candidatus Omnitrophota bacterium]
MIIQAEICEDGVVKVSDPELRGKKILLTAPDRKETPTKGITNWNEIWKIFQEADAIDFPRRSHEDILRDLRAFRESE